MVVLMKALKVLLLLGLALLGQPTEERKPDRVISILAERFTYNPSKISVKQGELVEFVLESDDTDHGFRIVGTDVNADIPKRRRGETVVKFVADTEGTFVIECSRPCGAGHTAMRATLIVK